ncbi:MAG: hypothetical protein FWB71_07000, partial [Defluviitaleaceae bacterium]|nr:hypothetical protein [Defluviitaleaceae bacterium]
AFAIGLGAVVLGFLLGNLLGYRHSSRRIVSMMGGRDIAAAAAQDGLIVYIIRRDGGGYDLYPFTQSVIFGGYRRGIRNHLTSLHYSGEMPGRRSVFFVNITPAGIEFYESRSRLISSHIWLGVHSFFIVSLVGLLIIRVSYNKKYPDDYYDPKPPLKKAQRWRIVLIGLGASILVLLITELIHHPYSLRHVEEIKAGQNVLSYGHEGQLVAFMVYDDGYFVHGYSRSGFINRYRHSLTVPRVGFNLPGFQGRQYTGFFVGNMLAGFRRIVVTIQNPGAPPVFHYATADLNIVPLFDVIILTLTNMAIVHTIIKHRQEWEFLKSRGRGG